MWKRLPLQPRKDSDNNSRPAVPEPYYEEHYPDDPATLTALPSFSSRPSTCSGKSENYRLSSAPTVSSAYSQDSHDTAHRFIGYVEAQDFRSRTQDTASSRSLSRILDHYGSARPDDSGGTPTSLRSREADDAIVRSDKNSAASSNISLLKRVRSNLVRSKPSSPTDAEIESWRAPRAQHPSQARVRNNQWEDTPGESTFTATSKPPKVSAATYGDPFSSYQDNKTFGVQVSITGPPVPPKKASFAEKAARFGRDAFASDSRKDNTFTVVKRSGTILSKSSYNDSDSDVSLRAPRTDADQRSETFLAPAETPHRAETATSCIPPLNVDKRNIPTAAKPSVTDPSQAYPSPVSTHVNTPPPRTSSISRKPVGSGASIRDTLSSRSQDTRSRESVDSYAQIADLAQQPRSHFSWTTYASSVIDDSPISGPSMIPELHEVDDPGSRFSWTTANTNTIYQPEASPPSSPPRVATTSIMERRHPLPRAAIPPTPPRTSSRTQHLQVTTTTTPSSTRSSTSTSPSAISPASATKSLPPPPTLSSTRTHIDALTAQRDDLSLQHANLQKLINSVLKVDLASPLVVDEKMRRAAKKRLEGLKERLGEVEREEHEVGRALARARRRVEREEGAESGLWVRRATG